MAGLLKGIFHLRILLKDTGGEISGCRGFNPKNADKVIQAIIALTWRNSLSCPLEIT